MEGKNLPGVKTIEETRNIRLAQREKDKNKDNYSLIDSRS